MEKKNALTITAGLLIAFGLLMIYLGGFYGSKVMYPPIVTGLGFFVIAWLCMVLKKE